MQEIKMKQLQEKLDKREPLLVLYVYSPLCGTCKLASNMLEVIEASYPAFVIHKLNINHARAFAQTWKVKSVPCLFVFQKGLGVERMYAFHSIAHIHTKMKPYAALAVLQNKPV